MLEEKALIMAQEGNTEAIEFLLSKSLESRVDSLRVEIHSSTLYVFLESDQALNQQEIAPYVKLAVSLIGLKSVQFLEICAKQVGIDTSIWIEKYELNLESSNSQKSVKSTKGKNKKILLITSAVIITIGALLISPKISALIEHNNLVAKINQIPDTSKMNSLELRKQAILDITVIIEKLKVTNTQLYIKDDDVSLVKAQTRLEELKKIVDSDEKVQAVLNNKENPATVGANLNSASSSSSVNDVINYVNSTIEKLENLDKDSIFINHANDKLAAYKLRLTKIKELKVITEEREIKKEKEQIEKLLHSSSYQDKCQDIIFNRINFSEEERLDCGRWVLAMGLVDDFCLYQWNGQISDIQSAINSTLAGNSGSIYWTSLSHADIGYSFPEFADLLVQQIEKGRVNIERSCNRHGIKISASNFKTVKHQIITRIATMSCRDEEKTVCK